MIKGGKCMFMQKSKGAISIFLIIILMSSFLLGGFFIDASRILVAKRKVKMAMNTAARSTLAHYDTTLVGEYGIYGLDQSKADELFKKYFEVNMKRGTSEDIKMYQYTITSSGANGRNLLSQGDNLQRQITEFEKYRAPVNMTIGVVSMIKDAFTSFGKGKDLADEGKNSAKNFKWEFKGITDTVTNSMTEFSGQLVNAAAYNLKERVNDTISNAKEKLNIEFLSNDDIEGFFKDMDDKLKEMNIELDKVNGKIEAYEGKQKEIFGDDGKGGKVGELNANIAGQYGADYDANRSPEETNIQEETTEPLNKQAREKTDNIRNKIIAVNTEVSNAKNNIKNANSAYKSAVEEYNNAVGEWENKKNTSGINEMVKEGEKTEKRKGELEKEISESLSLVGLEYQVAHNYYLSYKNGTDTQKREVKEFVEKNENEVISEHTQQILLSDIFSKCDEISSLNNDIVTLTEKIEEKNGEIKEAEKAMKEAHENVIRKQINLLDEIEKVRDINIKAESVDTELEIKKVDNSKNQNNEYLKILERLKKLEDIAGRKITPVGDSTSNIDDPNDNDIFSLFEKVSTYITRMIEKFSSLENIRDECYLIDYIMERNTYLTSQSGYNHWFACGEVEYIIFGNENQMANIVAAVGSIYFMRFAIDTLDYFIRSANPEIISRLITAAGRGLWQAGKDMLDMIFIGSNVAGDSAKGCPICPSLSKFGVKLKYSDHLRLFMLLNTSSIERQINAMNATLVDEKGSTPMTELCTEIECSAEVEVNMIILSMFNLDVLSGGNFRNGNYVIREKIVEGY